MKARRTWTLFVLGCLAGCAGLAWLSRTVLERSRATAEAALAAQLAEDQRTALARMDLLFAPLLARAAARAEGAIGSDLAFRVGIQTALLEADPSGNPMSHGLRTRADAVWNAVQRPPHVLLPLPDRGAELEQWTQRAVPRSTQEFLARGNSNFPNNPNVALLGSQLFPALTSGSFLVAHAGGLQPDWEAESQVLAFGRRLQQGSDSTYQVFRFDWPALEAHLLSVTRDLFPTARLEPVAPDAPPAGDRLATLPARLVVPTDPRALPLDRALAAALGGAWLLALVAVAGAAFALRASQGDATRQRRFTAAVTHELRTPLTTFRLYGEMLARGMVPPERQGEYLATIEREAGRLGALVENVLAYARLERGQAPPARERVRLDALVARHRASLEERCRRAGTALALELAPAAEEWLTTDVEGVGLVLANLVDNACKYGAPAGGHDVARPIRLSALLEDERVGLALEDPGPGVPAAVADAIFLPFERGGRDESDPAPGVGLGLALAREVARALGGDLVLEPARGARFVLWLPRA